MVHWVRRGDLGQPPKFYPVSEGDTAEEAIDVAIERWERKHPRPANSFNRENVGPKSEGRFPRDADLWRQQMHGNRVGAECIEHQKIERPRPNSCERKSCISENDPHRRSTSRQVGEQLRIAGDDHAALLQGSWRCRGRNDPITQLLIVKRAETPEHLNSQSREG